MVGHLLVFINVFLKVFYYTYIFFKSMYCRKQSINEKQPILHTNNITNNITIIGIYILCTLQIIRYKFDRPMMS